MDGRTDKALKEGGTTILQSLDRHLFSVFAEGLMDHDGLKKKKNVPGMLLLSLSLSPTLRT